MLQPPLQLRLTGRWKSPELRIVFERATLLVGREIFVATQPVSGMTGLVWRSVFLGSNSLLLALALLLFALQGWPCPLLHLLPLASRLLHALRRTPVRPLALDERGCEQQSCCHYACEFSRAQHG